MIAVILAGGKGTRLKPLTAAIPKPLLPLGETPILEVVLRQLASAGIERVVLTLGHLSQFFVATIGDGSRLGIEIQYLIEDEPLGTAGALRALPQPAEPVLVMNGDILTTLNYRDLFEFHRRIGASATIALNTRQVPVDFGVVEVDEGGYLAAFREKPTLAYEVSMGINVLSPDAFPLIPSQGRFDMPDLLEAIKRSGKRVACFRSDCYWQDIGRFDDYVRASEDFSSNPARFLPARL